MLGHAIDRRVAEQRRAAQIAQQCCERGVGLGLDRVVDRHAIVRDSGAGVADVELERSRRAAWQR